MRIGDVVHYRLSDDDCHIINSLGSYCLATSPELNLSLPVSGMVCLAKVLHISTDRIDLRVRTDRRFQLLVTGRLEGVEPGTWFLPFNGDSNDR